MRRRWRLVASIRDGVDPIFAVVVMTIWADVEEKRWWTRRGAMSRARFEQSIWRGILEVKAVRE